MSRTLEMIVEESVIAASVNRHRRGAASRRDRHHASLPRGRHSTGVGTSATWKGTGRVVTWPIPPILSAIQRSGRRMKWVAAPVLLVIVGMMVLVDLSELVRRAAGNVPEPLRGGDIVAVLVIAVIEALLVWCEEGVHRDSRGNPDYWSEMVPLLMLIVPGVSALVVIVAVSWSALMTPTGAAMVIERAAGMAMVLAMFWGYARKDQRESVSDR